MSIAVSASRRAPLLATESGGVASVVSNPTALARPAATVGASVVPVSSSKYEALEVDGDGEGWVGLGATPFAAGTSTFRQGVFNTANTIVGAGIISLPYALNEAGCWAGLTAMVVMATLTEYSLRLLMRTAMLHGHTSYEALARDAFGRGGFIAVCASRFTFSGGAMVAFLLILGDTVAAVAAAGAGPDGMGVSTLTLRRWVILVASLSLILPLCLLRDVTSLSRFSLLSVAAVLVMEVVVLAQLPHAHAYFANSCADGGNELGGACARSFTRGGERDAPSVVEWSGLFPALAIFAFAFTCHDSSFIIVASLRDPTLRQWSRIVRRALFVATALCVCMALPGYLTFRQKTDPNLLNNYPLDDNVMNFVRSLYAFTMVLTFPMCFNVCRSVLNAARYGEHAEPQTTMPLRRHLLLTLPLFCVTLVLALVVTELGLVLELTGALAATMVAFLLPAACTLQLAHRSTEGGGASERRRAWALLLFGSAMGITASVQAIQNAG
eukprot:g7915.t1